MEFFATCPASFEPLLASELASLGIPQTRPLKGQVAFGGDLSGAYRVCLWSRLASRVVAVLARGDARDADELYDTVRSVAWEEHLPPNATFAIDAHGTNRQLRSSQFVALRARDAVNDRLLSRRGARPVADPSHPDLGIIVRLSRDRATVGIDLAGDPLFQRGYEAARGSRRTVAPLRPDYAAALLAEGSWDALSSSAREGVATIVIPFSGAGTLAVEALAQARHLAPGLLRQRWGFAGWAQHDATIWRAELDKAREQAELEAQRPVSLILSDPRSGCDAAARQALRAAGLSVEPQMASPGSDAFASLFSDVTEPALLACDLSWVEEHALASQADALARMTQAATHLPAQSHAAVLAASALADRVLGPATNARTVLLGQTEATLRSYAPLELPTSSSAPVAGEEVPTLVPTSAQFARRLAKVYRQRRKWARREDVSCYRIYDTDLPDYAVSIDLFEGSETPGRWLQLYEYAPPKDVDPELAQARLLDVVTLAPRILDVAPQDVFVRVRTKARGGSQYADEAQRPPRTRGGRRKTPSLPAGAHLVDEGGLTFEVNFSSRLDCGIFLDHRETRSLLREMAKQTKGSKRFLNLFAYTGTGTCYAADGGARYTTTVDLSRPSLDWARRNMERNGFDGPEHEYVQADVIDWVSEQRHSRNRWDLVFCDVPTFSNSRRMRSSSFDVQRDHVELLIGVSRLLTRDGCCVFSCNLRTFRIDREALAKAGVGVEDITAQTIPEDFSRNPKIHHCYLIRRMPKERA